jgi:DNA modification methylase
MTVSILMGDVFGRLAELPDESVNCCVSSPPYYALRSYLPDNHPSKALEIGLEETPQHYVERLVAVFREVRRVLRDDGTLFLNLGDSYAGSWGAQSREHAGKHAPNVSAISANQVRAASRKATGTGRIPRGTDLKPKDLMGIPWEVSFALRADGWWLRDAIVWAKPNGMPGSQEDRCTSSYEMIFMLSKSADYWSDFDAIKTPPRESSMARLAQDVQAQAGSHRANGGGKSNGPMRAVGGGKQRGHGRRHAGFNERCDAMSREEQQAKPAMMRNVWFVSPASFSQAHYAVMPDEIARRCILAGCPYGGTVLDPFGGAGTTGLVASRLGREAILIELSETNAAMAQRRLKAAFADANGADEACGLEPLPLFSGDAA